MSSLRPDPDSLLAAIKKDTARQQRGKLRIFLGMAAGVGKTYAMLEAAKERKADGVDVVIGYVETHGRKETEALVEGLEIIPRQTLEHRGAKLEEMDLDAVLARKPALVLVDELAHTNVPGARHAKRYQDVIELVGEGIDVWTTVNVQHFESRADAVNQITGIRVHERVPDSILDIADGIELIDLSPEDLRKRLSEGKVYTPERVEVAANNFFRVGNLTALREMALRLTAEHVDHQLRDYMEIKRIAGPWKSGDRLMVAVGPSPFSERLIRWTRRMAYNLEAPWLAAYIETPTTLSHEQEEKLAQNLELVQSLGGEIVTTADKNIVSGLLRVARQRNATQIVIGKPVRKGGLGLFYQPSLVDDLITDSGDIDIYVVTGDENYQRTQSVIDRLKLRFNSTWQQYIWALAIVAVVTGVNLILVDTFPWFGHQVVGLTELLAVLLIAVYIGRGPALAAAAASAISWNFLFIEPRFTFEVSHVQDVILLLLYFAIALFTGNLTARLRRQELQARRNADRTMALYTLAQEASTAVDMDQVLQTTTAQIEQVFDADVAVLLGQGASLSRQPHRSSTMEVHEKDYGVALWSYQHRMPAGQYTETLPMASAQFLPLLTAERTVGVIGIRTRNQERLTFDQAVLLQTFVSQMSLVIERELLDEAAQQSTMLRESERLYTALLNSISHELRTPLATITGAASSLLDVKTEASRTSRAELVQEIQAAADRLNRLVENLLDMSRLESGRLTLQRDWCDIGDIIGVAVNRLKACLSERPVQLLIEPNLPLIYVDYVLVEQVMINLLDNVCQYTPAGTPVMIKARRLSTRVSVRISDRGPGIAKENLERIFDKFYRLPGSSAGGTGLGLSIARGLIEAHGGTLVAENNPEGGVSFIMTFPFTNVPLPVREAKL
jgi:two-component system, OmpR family, sensor histidine kinase KdpD